jgi:hypothetical protein
MQIADATLKDQMVQSDDVGNWPSGLSQSNHY